MDKINEVLKSVKIYGSPPWSADFRITNIDETLRGISEGVTLNLHPDFQRGHVWTEEQELSFIENVIKRIVPRSSLTVTFNCPTWQKFSAEEYCDLENELVCMDGLQRLTTLKKFEEGKIKPFGLSLEDMKGTKIDPDRVNCRLTIQIFNFQTRKEILQYYYDFNAGGTPHSLEEIERVRMMMEEENNIGMKM